MSGTSTFQSNGLCQQTCVNYAFAILQDKSCWCSNFAPADTTGVSGCSSPCPGYPSDLCGNASANLYGYIAIGPSPSGTVAASTQSVPTSASSQEVSNFGSSFWSYLVLLSFLLSLFFPSVSFLIHWPK